MYQNQLHKKEKKDTSKQTTHINVILTIVYLVLKKKKIMIYIFLTVSLILIF